MLQLHLTSKPVEARLKGMQSGQRRRGGVHTESDAALKMKRFGINFLLQSLLVGEAADDGFSRQSCLVPEVEPGPTFGSLQSVWLPITRSDTTAKQKSTGLNITRWVL